jgi:uncharacterized protein (DUF885 family)
MMTIVRKLNFQGSLQDFMLTIRNNPNFYANSEDEFLSFIRNIAKRADQAIPLLFKNLPRCPYGVEPMYKNLIKILDLLQKQ